MYPTTMSKATTAEKTLVANTQSLPVDVLLIDPVYQRKLSHTQVNDIVRDFNPRRFGVLKVSFRDGKYYVIDGQHRLAAARLLDYKRVPCIIEAGMTQQSEAEDFSNQQDNMRRVSTLARFMSSLAAGNPYSIEIYKSVTTFDYTIQGFGIDCTSADCISSVATLQAIAHLPEGLTLLDWTLYLIRTTWNGQSKATLGFVISGTAAFLRRFGCDNINCENFSKQLSDKLISVIGNYQSEKYDHHIMSDKRSDRLFSNLLAKEYNKGFSSRSKQRLVWEEN
jgi:hypothetical protein